MEQRPMSEAPRDGTPILAEIPGNGRDNVIAWYGGYADANDEPCYCWVMVDDWAQEPPESWTDGVCWGTNHDGVPSVQPVSWRPL